MSILELHTKDISQLCQRHRVRRLYAFGSVLTARFSSHSDIDFIVDFEARDVNGYADNYFTLKSSLEAVFKRQVDLLEEKAIKNPYFKRAVFKQRKLVYES